MSRFDTIRSYLDDMEAEDDEKTIKITKLEEKVEDVTQQVAELEGELQELRRPS